MANPLCQKALALMTLVWVGASDGLSADVRRSDDNTALTLIETQAQAISQLQAKMAAMDAEHKATTQVITNLNTYFFLKHFHKL